MNNMGLEDDNDPKQKHENKCNKGYNRCTYPPHTHDNAQLFFDQRVVVA